MIRSSSVRGAASALATLTALALGLAFTGCTGGSARRLPEEIVDAGGFTADVVFVGGTVRTVADSGPETADGLAIAAGRIIHVGGREDAMSLVGPSTRLIEMNGGCLVPGFIDAHGHVLSYGLTLHQVDLVGAASADEACRRVQATLAGREPGELIQGRGWDQNIWPVPVFPDHGKLDAVAPVHPVILTRIDGHAVWVNGLVLDRAGITAKTPDPAGGLIVRDPKSGEPTGVLIDNATALVEDQIPEPEPERREELLRSALSELARFGLTGVHDAGVDAATLEAYQRLGRRGEMPIRVYIMLEDDPALIDQELRRGPRSGLHDGHLSIRSIKLYADGALGSRGAALLEPYSDDPQTTGLLLSTQEHIEAVTDRALAARFQVAVHAIGDRGNRIALNAYEAALNRKPTTDHRLRIEHAQVIAPSDLLRFARLGVIPSMQPTHCTSDMRWATARLGPRRLSGAYAWKSLLDLDCRIAAGSDFPVESPNPLLGLQAATTRREPGGWPPDGFLPGQRMTRMEALRSFTRDAAFAAFQENDVGTLAVGRRADVVLLDRDPITTEPMDLASIQVRLTMVGGRVVYSPSDE